MVGHFGADDARPIEEFHDTLRRTAAESDYVYVDIPAHASGKRTRLSSRTLLKVPDLAQFPKVDRMYVDCIEVPLARCSRALRA